MTAQYLPHRHSTVANADLSALQFTLVTVDTSTAKLASAAAATAPILGVLENKPTSGQTAEWAGPGCIAKVKAGGNIAPQDKLTGTTGGAAIATTTTGQYYVGFALATGVSGDLVPVLIAPGIV